MQKIVKMVLEKTVLGVTDIPVCI